ncbi:MAG TPA: hypothetical protein VMU51_04750 [Mycobacteriales bacterium]|nr:hypothetical protein [Mycobacteriales bacterium]
MVSATDSDGAGNEQISPERTAIYNLAVVNGQVVVFLNIASPTPINLWLHYLAEQHAPPPGGLRGIRAAVASAPDRDPLR